MTAPSTGCAFFDYDNDGWMDISSFAGRAVHYMMGVRHRSGGVLNPMVHRPTGGPGPGQDAETGMNRFDARILIINRLVAGYELTMTALDARGQLSPKQRRQFGHKMHRAYRLLQRLREQEAAALRADLRARETGAA